MITQMRVAFRLQRFEIVVMAIAVVTVVVSALIVRGRLDAVAVSPDWWLAWFDSGPFGPGACEDAVLTFLRINEDEAGKIMASMALLPLAVGLFLGVPLVAREIEGGTAPTAWFLAASRSRWLVGRVLPVLIILLVLVTGLAMASEVLWSGREPWSPALRFGDAGLHGPVVAAKGLAAFGLALLAGAALGRLLPAIIVGTALSLVLFLGGEMARGVWLQSESMRHLIVVDPSSGGNQENEFPGGTYFSQWWRTPDGELLYEEQALQRVPEGVDQYEWLYANYDTVMTGVPGSAYPEWARLETTGFALIGLGALIVAFPVVSRRRPY